MTDFFHFGELSVRVRTSKSHKGTFQERSYLCQELCPGKWWWARGTNQGCRQPLQCHVQESMNRRPRFRSPLGMRWITQHGDGMISISSQPGQVAIENQASWNGLQLWNSQWNAKDSECKSLIYIWSVEKDRTSSAPFLWSYNEKHRRIPKIPAE